MYFSTKTWGNDRGLSCCFRQWRATHSHCSLLHGYSIGIKLIFKSETLDQNNWVQDFGGLTAFKEWAEYMFDHTLIVARDDPHLELFKNMATLGLQDTGGVCDLRLVNAVGCEQFAKMAYDEMHMCLKAYQAGCAYYLPSGKQFLPRYSSSPGVQLVSAEVFEHAGNSAIYQG